MKTILILIICFSTIMTFGQETKEVKVKFPKSKQIRESYFTLESNPHIKHGKYFSYYKTSKQTKDKTFIKEEGEFKNGLKNGQWKYYEHPSLENQGEVISIENYNNGIKTGVWETYHYELEGTAVELFDHDINASLEPRIIVHLKYPMLAKENGIEGEVIVKYIVNADCSIENVEIVKSLNKDCDNEAIESLLKIGRLKKKYLTNDCKKEEKSETFTFSLE